MGDPKPTKEGFAAWLRDRELCHCPECVESVVGERIATLERELEEAKELAESERPIVECQCEDGCAIQADNARLREKLEKIKTRHCDDGNGACYECRSDWPCLTAEDADAALHPKSGDPS